MYTLKDILDLEIMSDAKLLNKDFDFSALTVKYVSVQEPPVEGFVRKNEIVISTARTIEDSDSLLTFVKNIYHSNAAALIFSFVPQSDLKMSQDVLDFADIHQFPLFEIPWNVRFSDVIEAVMNKLKEKKTVEETKYIELQKELLQMYFHSKTLEDIAKKIATTTHHSIKITDKNKNEKGVYVFTDTEEFHEIRIEINNYLYGYVYLSLQPFQQEEPVNIDFLIFYINIPLSLWFVKEEVIHMTGLKIRNDYVWKLANEKKHSQELINQGVQLGFNMDITYFCVLLKIHSENKDADQKGSNVFTIVEKKILALMKPEHLNVLLSFKNDTFILFLEEQIELEVPSLLDKIEQEILSLDSRYSFNWGIAEKPQSNSNFSEQYRMAKTALDQAIDLNIPRLTFKQSRITSMVNQITPRHEVRQQAHSLLEPIIWNDRFNENGMDLINTITVYLKTNLNTSETSRKLNIHRQSLLYRFQKFEELTMLSLEDADDLFLLQYYLRLLGKFQ